MLSVVLLALSCVLVIAGCGGGGGDTPPVTADLLPLKVDNQWKYDYTSYSSASALRAASLVRQRPGGLLSLLAVGGKARTTVDTVTITGTQSIGGQQWFAAVSQYAGGAPEPAIYLRHSNQGLLRKDDPAGTAYYLLKAPVEVGTSWTVPFVENNITYIETLTIRSVSDTISVPAGTFTNCVEIENVFSQTGQPDDVITSWYAAGVGEVREERHLGATLDYELQLTSYPTSG